MMKQCKVIRGGASFHGKQVPLLVGEELARPVGELTAGLFSRRT